MTKHLRSWASAVGILAAGAFTSCTYAPYPVDSGYAQAGGGDYSGGDSKSGGYGEGYGYGSPGFTTSAFVGTGNPQWGYDPYCYSYYDYYRRSYYDPFLFGYYPIGYRPMRVYGCPHPYGWRTGVRYCPPPRYVRNVAVVNYHNRATMYRNSSYGWAKQVRQMPETHGRVKGERPATNSSSGHIIGTHPSGNQGSSNRPVTGTRPSTGSSSHQAQGGNSNQSGHSVARTQSSNRTSPSVGSRPSTSGSTASSQPIKSYSGQRNGRVQNQSRQSYSGGGNSGRGQARQSSSGGGNANRQSQSQNSNGGKKGGRGY